jgi:N-acylneuraminate-9-phosphatase
MPKLLLLDMDHTLCDTQSADEVGTQHLIGLLQDVASLNSGEAEAMAHHYMGILYQPQEGEEWLKKEGEEEGAYRGRLLQLCLAKRVNKKLAFSTCCGLIEDLMTKRFNAFDFFEGVPQLLYTLRKTYRTVVLSNGPLYSQQPKADKISIGDHVDRVVLAGAHPWSKPDPRIFQMVLREENYKASEALHVGDSLGSDIAGAIAAKIPNVWINPARKSHPREITPNHILESVLDLPKLLIELSE